MTNLLLIVSALTQLLRCCNPSGRLILILTALVFLGLGNCPAQTTLLNTNLDTATLGAYANASVINSSGATTTQLTVAVASPQVVQVANVGGTNQALQFIDNSAAATSCSVKNTFTALSTTTTGNNCLTASFSITPLGPTGTSPTLELLINAGSDSAGSSVTAVQIDFSGNGNVSYKSGTTSISAPALTIGTKYNVSLYLDLSSATQDTWGLTITNAGTGAVVHTASNLNTRAANIAPDRIVFSGAVNAAAASASAFAQIDDLNFSVSPYGVSLIKGPYYADCLWQTRFSQAALGTYADSTVINAGQPVQERVGVNITSPQAVEVVNVGGTKQAVQFTDNSTTVITSPTLKKYFNALATGGTGSNYLTGSFEITPLAPSGGNPTFEFMINAGADTAGSTVTDVQIDIRGTGAVSYKVGSGSVSGPVLTPGISYLVHVDLDLSSATQDTWGFDITRQDTGAVVYSAANLNTRAANIAPDRIVFNGGVNSTVVNTLPFVQLGSTQFFAFHRPELEPVPLRMGGGDMINGAIDSITQAKFQTLGTLGAGLCRMGLYPTYYWNYNSTNGPVNTPNTVSVENQMLMAHTNNTTPILLFSYYGQYQSLFTLGDYNRWYQIGQAFATKYSPNSTWLTSQGITNWGVTNFYAFNEPDTIGGTANTPPIPVTGTVSYREALRGLADGVHSVSANLKVYPGGFARPNNAGDWTCNGYCPAIADLLNNGTLDGITLHTYFISTSMANYTASSQNTFRQVKSACGITRDVNFYCDEYNYVLNGDTQANAAIYYLTALWDALGVVGNSGQVVSQLAIPWNLFNTSTADANYGMCTQLTPSWLPTPRGQVFQWVTAMTQGMQFIAADPLATGEYKLIGNNQTLWVWQNRSFWTNHAGTTYTVQNIPLEATTLTVYNSTGLIQTIALTGQTSYQVTGLTTGQTYMFLVNSQP